MSLYMYIFFLEGSKESKILLKVFSTLKQVLAVAIMCTRKCNNSIIYNDINTITYELFVRIFDNDF